ncbi:MAG: hypothetical protein M1819_007430 [Sarea resinae]|nr:MAG: hypothetical protein M1819_007430 [Sarea resinae]
MNESGDGGDGGWMPKQNPKAEDDDVNPSRWKTKMKVKVRMNVDGDEDEDEDQDEAVPPSIIGGEGEKDEAESADQGLRDLFTAREQGRNPELIKRAFWWICDGLNSCEIAPREPLCRK